ncbi:MAG: STAS domain-containing protein [Bacteroidales bacterium]|nr:STAS domain-containing protein [Bacteroidales bacterium]
MEVIVTKDSQQTTASLVGSLDTLAAQQIAPQMNELKDFEGTLVLDCEKLSYISSSGLRLFLMLRKAAAERGGKIIVRNISNEIRSVFMMTGFLNLFDIQ